MGMTDRELWTAIHGIVLWTIFLLAFAGGFVGLWSLRPEWITVAGVERRLRRLSAGVWIAAAACWIAVVTGTYVLYPWYRARPPEGATDLAQFPRAYLRAHPDLAEWHDAMEWKQHIAWLAPILATAVAYVIVRYGPQLAREEKIRQALVVLFAVAFLAAAVAGVSGGLINKVAPIR